MRFMRRFCRPQFSLRSLLGLLFAAGLASGWVADRQRDYEREQVLLAQIHGSQPFSKVQQPLASNRSQSIPVFL